MNIDAAETIKAVGSANDWSVNAAMLFCVLIVLAIFYLNRKDNREREISYAEERKSFLETLDGFRTALERLSDKIEFIRK
ncbi:MAG: hypothetical protein LBQ18_05985 [Campylobacteraceae bacterium]|jgi:hypothetical protein|nr:hypothetical protein [Campylobacteraceae bacterium]